jgi:ribosomal protein S24E
MSFQIEILDEKKNPLIDRVELKVKIDHFGNGTPNRLEVKKKIASMQGSNEKLTIIKDIQTYFGSTQDLAKIYIYENEKELEFFEPFHIKVRNLPKEKREEIYKLKRKKEPYKHLFDL